VLIAELMGLFSILDLLARMSTTARSPGSLGGITCRQERQIVQSCKGLDDSLP